MNDFISSKEKERYSRHILLKSIGLTGIEKLKKSWVLVIGAGGIGSSLLTYLSVSGVQNIRIVDHDHIELSNLGRQFLYQDQDIGKFKAEIAALKIQSMNPHIHVEFFPQMINDDNFLKLSENIDLIIETVDHFTNKLMIHDLCQKWGKTLIHGGVLGMQAQWMTILSKSQHYEHPFETTCFRCFFPHLGQTTSSVKKSISFTDLLQPNRDSCAVEGVFSPLCGIVGSWQAAEAIRFFTRPHQELLVNRMMTIDYSRNHFRLLSPKFNHCPHCHRNEIKQ